MASGLWVEERFVHGERESIPSKRVQAAINCNPRERRSVSRVDAIGDEAAGQTEQIALTLRPNLLVG